MLWRKLPGARSAGRVQSVALRLICERELEIEAFKSQDYWTVDADIAANGGQFTARLTHFDGKKLDRLSIATEAEAKTAEAAIKAGQFSIADVEKKPVKRHPAPPFITSTLQQEAARKLGYAAARTMKIAQGLYEGADIGGETVGLITYMRTDGVQMAPEAIAESREVIAKNYGARYAPKSARIYTSKAKNAQEAHEAIRPTSFERSPEKVARYLDAEQAKLYELVWKRALASQMESAEQERTTVDVASRDGRAVLRATGTVTTFDGFLTLYQESHDETADDEDSRRLPALSKGDAAKVSEVRPEMHSTEPPPRYSEASLVKKMEELGIGRPSTYATILSVLRDRNYVVMDRNRFIPDSKGRIVTAFLSSFFHRYVEYDFTADLEEQLDRVSAGELSWKQLLRDFWTKFSASIAETKELKFSAVIDALDGILGPHMFPPRADGGDPRVCPSCGNGRLNLKLGRFGAFVGCSNYPECTYTRQMAKGEDSEAASPRSLGVDPDSGLEVLLKVGRFGPYVQLGETPKKEEPVAKPVKGEKRQPKAPKPEQPKRAGIPKAFPPDTIDLEKALRLLKLPREVGLHPESGKPIIAGFGRFGPYVAHDGTYASLETADDVFTVGLNHAVTLIAERKTKGRAMRGSEPLKDLGAKPNTQIAVKVMKGRYGPYVTDGTVNATLPKDADPMAVTMDEALALLAAREAKGPVKKKPGRKAPAPKKADAPKAAAKAKPAKAKVKAKPKPKPAKKAAAE